MTRHKADKSSRRLSRNRRSAAGRVALMLVIVLVVLVGVSLMPLERWTGGRISNFSLISDLLPDSLLAAPSLSSEQVDPELLKERAMAASVAAERDSLGRPLYTDSIIGPALPARDSLDGTVIIEDYTLGRVGLYHLQRALRDSTRTARIAVVGDSYIEGDIMTQDLRSMLQQAHGGSGTGYMNLHSDFPGFRRSVRQGGQGWRVSNNKKGDRALIGLSEQYARPGAANSTATYAGTSALPGTDSWTRSRALFVAPAGGRVTARIDGREWAAYNLAATPGVQQILLEGPTTKFELQADAPGITALGVWLDGDAGVSVDCMSSRGYSGVSLTEINMDLCRDMGRFVDYDLVVLEFGINAMTSSQTNYSHYADRMVAVINHVRRCYPNADILLMGIGDRGERRGGGVTSMGSAPYMVEAQRTAARRAHCLFYDTREAMGGDGAIVDWSSRGLANKDYVHLTHKGGARLASHLFEAVQRQLGIAIPTDSLANSSQK